MSDSVDDVVYRLLENLKSGDETARRYAAEDLGYGQYKEAIDGLIEGLSDDSIAVAEACADGLVRVGGSEVAEKISDALASEDVRLRNFSAEVLSQLGEPAVSILNKLLMVDDRDVRKFAVDTLGQIRSESSMEALIKGLDDTDVNVAASAADGLGEIGNESHLPVLQKYLDSEVWMKCSVIRGMGAIGGEKALQALIPMLADEDLMVKVSAVQAIAEVKDIRGIPELLKLLSREALELFGNEVLISVEKILNVHPDADVSGLCDHEKLKPVLELLSIDDESVQMKALKVLGRFKPSSCHSELVNMFFSANSEVRKEAVKAIILIDSDELEPFILLLRNSDASVEAKAAALHCIGQSKNPGRYEILLEFLTINDPVLPRVTLDALAPGLDPVPTEALGKLLNSEVSDIRISAAQAMGRLGSDEFIDLLIGKLEHDDHDFVEAVDQALIDIGNTNSDSIIRPYMNSLSSRERKMAYEYFGARNPEQASEKFIEGIRDKDAEIRMISYKVIENLGIADLDLIRQGMKDEDPLVQIQAARTLRSIAQDENVLDFIQETLAGDTLERIKVELIRVLAGLGEFGAIDILIDLLDDDSVWVRIEVVEVLRMIGDYSVVEHLEKLLDHENDDLVEAVQIAIDELDF